MINSKFAEEYWEQIRNNIPQGKIRKQRAFELFNHFHSSEYYNWEPSSYLFLDAQICYNCLRQIEDPRLDENGLLRHLSCQNFLE